MVTLESVGSGVPIKLEILDVIAEVPAQVGRHNETQENPGDAGENLDLGFEGGLRGHFYCKLQEKSGPKAP